MAHEDIWKDVPGYEGLYQISSRGQVKSLRRKKLLKISKNWFGHMIAILCKGGKPKSFYVHRLVLEAFVGPCPEGMECRHYPDRDPSNNRLENLSWATRSVNAKDKVEHKTFNLEPPCGEKNGRCRITDDQVSDIRKMYHEGMTQSAIAVLFDTDQGTISSIVNYKSRKNV